MSEERPRWLLKILLVVVALGGLGWAIWRYSNIQPEEGPDNSTTPPGAVGKGPPSPPQLPPIPPEKGPKDLSRPNG